MLSRRLLVLTSAVVLAGAVSCAPAPAGTRSPAASSTSTASATASGSPSPSPSASPPVESPTAEPSPTESPFVARTATINVSGDLLWHNTLWKSAQLDGKGGRMDFAPQLASLKAYVSAADLGICHSEVPFAAKGGPYSNYPMFKIPQEAAAGIAATGWDLCTTASNHSMDAGWDGLVRTLDVHKANGIVTSGTFATEAEAATPVIFTTAGGVKVAVISQTFGLNGLPLPKGRPWAVNLLNADATIAMAKKAKAAGADIVAVHMHAGVEYSRKLDQQQTTFAKAVTAAPEVNFVFGQHAHVVQPIDKLNDKWVFFGMGNLIAASSPSQPYTYDGYMGEITFTEQPDHSFAATKAEFAPTMITKLGGGRPARVFLIPDELKKSPSNAKAMRESAARTRATVRSLGVEGLTERE